MSMKTLFAILGCIVTTSAFAWNAQSPAAPQPAVDAIQRHLFEHAFAASGQAPAGDAAPSVVVKFGDLDLSRPEEAAMLYSRLRHAARTVCPAPRELRDLDRLEIARDCYNAALARAVHSVDQGSFARTYDHAAFTAYRSPAR
jgi:UrcA family protein